MCKVFKLIVDESAEPVILEEDEVLEDILIRLESISHRIDDIQYSLIKNNDEASSLDLDISEIDFQSIKKYGVNLTPYYVIIKIWETPSYFKLPNIVNVQSKHKKGRQHFCYLLGHSVLTQSRGYFNLTYLKVYGVPTGTTTNPFTFLAFNAAEPFSNTGI